MDPALFAPDRQLTINRKWVGCAGLVGSADGSLDGATTVSTDFGVWGCNGSKGPLPQATKVRHASAAIEQRHHKTIVPAAPRLNTECLKWTALLGQARADFELLPPPRSVLID